MRWQGWVGSAVLALPFVVGTALGAAAERGGEEVFRFADPEINESSGLVVLADGHVVTVNDSGDTARVFTVDPGNGRTVATTTWPGDAYDVEALAPAPDNAVWVADIGDNRRVRDHVQVTHLPLDGGEATTYDLTYPDGARDAEALLAHPVTGRLYVVTKGLFGGEVLVAPKTLQAGRPNQLEQVATAGGLVTDGAFLPGGGAVVLRDYGRAWVVDAETWQSVVSWQLPRQQQGEGLAVDTTGGETTLLLSSEGVGVPVLREPVPVEGLAADLRGSPLGWVLQVLSAMWPF